MTKSSGDRTIPPKEDYEAQSPFRPRRRGQLQRPSVSCFPALPPGTLSTVPTIFLSLWASRLNYLDGSSSFLFSQYRSCSVSWLRAMTFRVMLLVWAGWRHSVGLHPCTSPLWVATIAGGLLLRGGYPRKTHPWPFQNAQSGRLGHDLDHLLVNWWSNHYQKYEMRGLAPAR